MARLLIVDDDQSERIILRDMLQRTGDEVYFASDGVQAFNIYERMSIDVVITDLQMLRVDGLEPILAVSGKGPELLAEAESTGALVALSKPVDPDELVRAIASVVQGNREDP